MARAEQPDKLILHLVGVLELVDEHVVPLLLALCEDLRRAPQELHGEHDEVVKVQRVVLLEHRLVPAVDLSDPHRGFPQQAFASLLELILAQDPVGVVLHLADHQLVLACKHLCQLRFCTAELGLQDGLEQCLALIGAHDLEAAADRRGDAIGDPAEVPPEQAQRDGVERARRDHGGLRAGRLREPVAQLARRLVGERHRHDLPRGDPLLQELHDPHRQHAGLSAAGPGDDTERSLCRRHDRLELLRAQQGGLRPGGLGRRPAAWGTAGGHLLRGTGITTGRHTDTDPWPVQI
mmetsp:Transcript_9043/g.21773  ORF Transcript_9043/g.21773 Transcript_9043/m.21773 type:complete len:293 (+) Transcript_9043:1266-2144(+)